MDPLDIIKDKIFDHERLVRQLAVWRFLEKKIVFTNGCFDILHRGHIEYLAKAAGYGDILIIGLNTDKSVSRLKGPSRPVQDENARAFLMASMHFVSAVTLFEEDTPYNLIRIVQPDVLVKGGDYKSEDIVGNDVVKARGGKVITIDFVKGYSTSGIIDKLCTPES
jgi:rfaE bifunctional protein nucleotidyltransferase chain/domain